MPWSGVVLQDVLNAVERSEIGFPLIVKYRYGYGSAGVMVCSDPAELEWSYRYAVSRQANTLTNRFIGATAETSVLVQEYIRGEEMRIVLVNDLEGCYYTHFITRIHAMRAGESDIATTLDPAELGDLPQRLSMLTRHVGVWGIDLRKDGDQMKIIDINPRFSGDYPFHHIAGADVPAILVAWMRGEVPDPVWGRSLIGVSGYKDMLPTIVPYTMS